jgi:tetratricopeptide (TPR) repeat protein
LALRIAGQLLVAHPAWPVAQLADMLADERHRLAQLAAGDRQVRAAFEVSYGQLACRDARMFRLLGLHPSPDFDVLATARLAGIDAEEAERVLGRLVLASLVSEHGSGWFGMHDLLRLFARDAWQQADDQADRDAAETRLVDHYMNVAGWLNSCIDPRLRAQAEEQAGVPLPSMREALEMFEAQRPSLLVAVGLAEQRGWDEQTGELAANMGELLRLLRHLDYRLTVFEAALAAARRAGNTVAEGNALNNLGEAYRGLRRFEEAVGCFREALAIFREAGDRHLEGGPLNSLGVAYRWMRRFEEAVGRYREALAIFRETGDRYDEGQTLNNLGDAYGQLRRFEEAVGRYREALAIRREAGDRYGESTTLTNLGNVYETLRRFEEAVARFREALAIRREIGDRYGEGQTLNNLGNTYRRLWQFEEAVGCYRPALAIFREFGDRYGEGTALSNIGFAYMGLRQPDRASGCWRDAAAAIREAGDLEQASLMEQLATNGRSRWRWWRSRRNLRHRLSS